MGSPPRNPELHDLHFAMLSALPLEGSKLGYHPLVKSVKQVVMELNKPLPAGVPKVTSAQAATQFGALHKLGLVKPVRSPAGHMIGWQVTPTGVEAIGDWTPPVFEAPPAEVAETFNEQQRLARESHFTNEERQS